VAISPLQFSADSGKSWTVATYESISADYKRAASVAISTDGSVTLWTPSHKTVNGNDVAGDYPVQRYANSAWTEVTGIDGASIVGDPENATVFYAFKKAEGAFYKSSDKGVTFTKAGAPGVSDWRKFRLMPGKTGDIWVPLAKSGLARSTDGAATFTAIPNVTYCEAVGFGKAAEAKTSPTVYIFGTVASVTGVFQSIDEGATWIRINDDDHEYGGLANGEFVAGDMNIFGVVYMSTAGRGIACRLPSSMVEVKEKSALSATADRASWRIQRGILHLSPLQGRPQTVSLYSLNGRRIFHQVYTCPTTVSLHRLLKVNGIAVLAIGSGKTITCQKVGGIAP
jgi:hypothetical protein